MLGYMLTTLAENAGAPWSIRTAGTHVVEGSAMSARTRDALLALTDIGVHHYGAHRSHQLDADDARWADVLLASEADHVRYVRSEFPQQGAKAVQLAQFVRVASQERPFDEQLRVATSIEPSKEFDIADPAGGDQPVYDACAHSLWDLAQSFAWLVGERSA